MEGLMKVGTAWCEHVTNQAGEDDAARADEFRLDFAFSVCPECFVTLERAVQPGFLLRNNKWSTHKKFGLSAQRSDG
jgi:hypothetical protein